MHADPLVLLFFLSSAHAYLAPLSIFRPPRIISSWALGASVPQEETVSPSSPTFAAKDDDASRISTPPDMKAYALGYKTVFEELPFRSCTPSVGNIPSDLEGTYFRSGPSMFSAGSIVPPKTSIVQPKSPPVPDGTTPDRMVLHPMEGDGAILGVTFHGDGAVTARYRYVRTAGFTNERKKGARLYKAMDSTRELGPLASGLGNDLPLPLFRHHLQPGLNRNRKNTSNTRAVYWGKRLITMWDGGQPFKLDGLALSTEGRTRLGGAIAKDDDPFGAKMVIDPVKNRAIFYCVNMGTKNSELRLYEFNSDFRLVGGEPSVTNVPGFAMLNDFCATKKYAVFIQPNVVANPILFMTSKEPGKTLTVGDGPATLHLIPRVGSSKLAKKFSIPADGWSEANIQFVNAYEGDGSVIVMDVIRSDPASLSGNKNKPMRWPWGESLDEYRAMALKKSLWRYTIETRSGSVSKQALYEGHCFFGVVNPLVSTRQHRYIYMNVGGTGSEAAPLQGIAKVDCESTSSSAQGTTQVWMPESYEFCGEPMYAPRQTQGVEDTAEDDGYILSVLFNGKKEESEIIILEANSIAKGPITRIPLGIAVPHGYFGCFTAAEEARWPADEIQRRSKLADKIESRGNMWNEVKSDFSGLGLRFDDFEEYFGMDMNDFFALPKDRK